MSPCSPSAWRRHRRAGRPHEPDRSPVLAASLGGGTVPGGCRAQGRWSKVYSAASREDAQRRPSLSRRWRARAERAHHQTIALRRRRAPRSRSASAIADRALPLMRSRSAVRSPGRRASARALVEPQLAEPTPPPSHSLPQALDRPAAVHQVHAVGEALASRPVPPAATPSASMARHRSPGVERTDLEKSSAPPARPGARNRTTSAALMPAKCRLAAHRCSQPSGRDHQRGRRLRPAASRYGQAGRHISNSDSGRCRPRGWTTRAVRSRASATKPFSWR